MKRSSMRRCVARDTSNNNGFYRLYGLKRYEREEYDRIGEGPAHGVAGPRTSRRPQGGIAAFGEVFTVP